MQGSDQDLPMLQPSAPYAYRVACHHSSSRSEGRQAMAYLYRNVIFFTIRFSLGAIAAKP
jgi:hypothetical protein